MSWWWGTAANGVVAVAYLAIAAYIFTGISRSNQWRANPLAVATGAIFLSCGIGHGLHFFHPVEPFFGVVHETSAASRVVLADWHVWVVDGTTAVVGIWYWSLRGRFRALVRGSALFEDVRERQRQALQIHDEVVQGLTKAKLSLELGEGQEAMEELEQSLEASRRIVTNLLGEEGTDAALGPGDLRRVKHRSAKP